MSNNFHTAAAKIRKALGSSLFTPGEYTPRDIVKILVMSKSAEPWETNNHSIADQLKRVPKWEHKGGKAMASTWVRLPDKPKVEKPKVENPLPPPPREETERGPVTQRLARMEMQLDLLCSHLGIPVQMRPEQEK